MTAIALILVPMSAAQAYASDIEIIDLPSASRTWILIIAPGCDYTESDGLRLRLAYNNTGYEAFLSNRYEVSCFTTDISKIESQALPLLRSVFPNDAFVFAYGESQERDYDLYIASKYGAQYYRTAKGNADVELGYAIAPFDTAVDIKHERAHIETCSAHGKDSNPNDVNTWTRATVKPWCMEVEQ